MEGNTKELQNLNGNVHALPTLDSTLSKSGFAAEAAAVGEALKGKLSPGDVVDDLETDDPQKPLSAAQGIALKNLAEKGGAKFAKDVIYDNSDSNLEANDVKYAIDLLVSLIRRCLSSDNDTIETEDIRLDSGNAGVRGNENGILLQALNEAMDEENRRVLALYNWKYQSELRYAATVEDIHNGMKSVYPLYGQHNKPEGSYVGNGGSEDFTLNTSGCGNVLMITSYSTLAFVTPNVCMVFDGSGKIFSHSSMDVNLYDGVLWVAKSSQAWQGINEKDVHYWYQVL